jgi:hypothetical protein
VERASGPDPLDVLEIVPPLELAAVIRRWPDRIEGDWLNVLFAIEEMNRIDVREKR